MKKLIVLAIILFSITACNKAESENSEFIGKWELKRISGGLHGGGHERTFQFLEFTDDKNCQWYYSLNSVLIGGSYELSKSSGKDFIEFDPGNDTTIYNFQSFKLEYKFLSSDSLYMDQGCCDLYDYLFVKVK